MNDLYKSWLVESGGLEGFITAMANDTQLVILE